VCFGNIQIVLLQRQCWNLIPLWHWDGKRSSITKQFTYDVTLTPPSFQLKVSCLAYGGEMCCHGIYTVVYIQWYSTTSGDQLQLGVTHVDDFPRMICACVRVCVMCVNMCVLHVNEHTNRVHVFCLYWHVYLHIRAYLYSMSDIWHINTVFHLAFFTWSQKCY
jgi:hypothetical protein